MSSGSYSSAHETSTTLLIGEDNTAVNYYRRSAIKFDLSSIPSNAVICSASLSLTVSSSSNASNDRTVRVYRVKTAWSEQTGTWNSASTGVTWQTAGASGVNDRESTDIGSSLVTAGAVDGFVQQWSLDPAKVQEMVGGSFTNNGFVLQPDTEVDDLHEYYSSDYSIAAQRPKLVIQYTVPIAAAPAAKVVFAPIAYLPPLQSGPIFSNAAFTYNGDGQRVKSVMQTNIATTTTYFVGNYYEVADPSTGSGQVVTKYYYAGSQRIAMRKNGTLNYLLSDHLGSTSIVTDAAGNVINQTQYKAWGEERYSSGTKQTGYGYTGQYSDSYINLLDYGSRRYDPELGRFIQPDTIIPGTNNPQAYDRYSYVFNNPVKYNDPTGHEPGDCYDRGYCETYKPKPPDCSIHQAFCLGWNWLTGGGDDSSEDDRIVFGPSEQMTRDLMNSDTVNHARTEFINNDGVQTKPYSEQVEIESYTRNFVRENTTTTFIGTYTVVIEDNKNGTATFTVRNTTGLKSLTHYYIPGTNYNNPTVVDFVEAFPNLPKGYPGQSDSLWGKYAPSGLINNTSTGPGRAIYQIYIWTEEFTLP